MRVFGGGRFGFCYAWKQMSISLSQGPEKMEYCFVDLVGRLHIDHVPCTCDDDFLCIPNVLRENIRQRNTLALLRLADYVLPRYFAGTCSLPTSEKNPA